MSRDNKTRFEHSCPVAGIWVDGKIAECPNQCYKSQGKGVNHIHEAGGARATEAERVIYEHFKRLGCFDPAKETKELMEDLVSIPQIAPLAAAWTREKPVEQGWYWLRRDKAPMYPFPCFVRVLVGDFVTNVFVEESPDETIISVSVSGINGEWSGPIAPCSR